MDSDERPHGAGDGSDKMHKEMKYCCEYFPKIAYRFGWFSYTDDNNRQVYLMPHITENDGERIRVNNCPVCGTEIRDISIPEDEFKLLKK